MTHKTSIVIIEQQCEDTDNEQSIASRKEAPDNIMEFLDSNRLHGDLGTMQSESVINSQKGHVMTAEIPGKSLEKHAGLGVGWRWTLPVSTPPHHDHPSAFCSSL